MENILPCGSGQPSPTKAKGQTDEGHPGRKSKDRQHPPGDDQYREGKLKK